MHMHQLTFIGPREFEWREVPAPKISDARQALVRPLAVSRCDLDLAIFRGNTPTQQQFAIGHEFAAEVLEIGDAVTTVKPGDRVVVSFQISCGECRTCKMGLTRSCESVPQLSTFGLPGNEIEYGGGFSERVLVPYADHMLFPIPNGASPIALAPASDNLPDGFRLVAPGLARWPGADVLVLGGSGAGSCGLYAVATAKALGAGKIDYVDTKPDRLTIAERLGANVIEQRIDEQTKPLGPYLITVDAQIKEASFYVAMMSTAPEGYCTTVGGYFGPTDMRPPWMGNYFNCITVRNEMVNAAYELRTVMPLIEKDVLKVTNVVSDVFPAVEAQERLLDSVKPVFVLDETLLAQHQEG